MTGGHQDVNIYPWLACAWAYALHVHGLMPCMCYGLHVHGLMPCMCYGLHVHGLMPIVCPDNAAWEVHINHQGKNIVLRSMLRMVGDNVGSDLFKAK